MVSEQMVAMGFLMILVVLQLFMQEEEAVAEETQQQLVDLEVVEAEARRLDLVLVETQILDLEEVEQLA